MPESLADRGARRGRRTLVALGDELRAARQAAGLSQRAVAAAGGISIAELSRIERARASWLGIVMASRVSAVVGLDLAVRSYPGSAPLRDAAHVRLAGAFRGLLGPRLVLRTEVPLGIDGDQRAWDAVVATRDGRMAVEFETRLADVQALVRRVNLKRRDGGIDLGLLVIADTRHNRAASRLAGPDLASAFPLGSQAVLRALTMGLLPDESGRLFLPASARPR